MWYNVCLPCNKRRRTGQRRGFVKDMGLGLSVTVLLWWWQNQICYKRSCAFKLTIDVLLHGCNWVQQLLLFHFYFMSTMSLFSTFFICIEYCSYCVLEEAFLPMSQRRQFTLVFRCHTLVSLRPTIVIQDCIDWRYIFLKSVFYQNIYSKSNPTNT